MPAERATRKAIEFGALIGFEYWAVLMEISGRAKKRYRLKKG
jgi:hypothetical protein